MIHQAKYWHIRNAENKIISCDLCPHHCHIIPNKRGLCGVRENQNGKLISLVYSKPCAVHIDPIEKKPLYHFLPGSKSFSIGTVGCNLSCSFCQNHQISKAKFEDVTSTLLPPSKVISSALKSGCKSISYTYTEPAVFFEYVLDTSKLARKKGIKNVLVSNGFINETPIKDLCEYIDAANIDLKSFDNNFYKEMCSGSLDPVLQTLKILKINNIWVEITNLIIPTKNDDLKLISKMVDWISLELGEDVPIHFSAFHPDYKCTNLPYTSANLLNKVKSIARKKLQYVYIGNLSVEEGSITKCPSCRRSVIDRNGYNTIVNHDNGLCKCGQVIKGVWS